MTCSSEAEPAFVSYFTKAETRTWNLELGRHASYHEAAAQPQSQGFLA